MIRNTNSWEKVARHDLTPARIWTKASNLFFEQQQEQQQQQ